MPFRGPETLDGCTWPQKELFGKIGQAEDVDRRIADLNRQSARTVQKVHAFQTDDMDGIERYWHKRFEDRPRQSMFGKEWFKLIPADIAACKKRIKFMLGLFVLRLTKGTH